jgi:hypothetical protein
LSWRKAWRMKLRIIATGGLSSQETCPLWKGFWLDGFVGVELRSVGTALADGLCELRGGGGITMAEGLHEWGRRTVSLKYILTFALQLRKSTKNLSPGSRAVRNYSLRRLGCLLPSSEGQPRQACWASVHLSPVGDLRQPAVGTRAFPVAELRKMGFPASPNFESKLAVSGTLSQWNPQKLLSLPVTKVQMCVSRSAKTRNI